MRSLLATGQRWLMLDARHKEFMNIKILILPLGFVIAGTIGYFARPIIDPPELPLVGATMDLDLVRAGANNEYSINTMRRSYFARNENEGYLRDNSGSLIRKRRALFYR